MAQPLERDITKAVVPLTALATIAGATWWLATSLHAVDSQLQSLRFELQAIRQSSDQALRRDEFRAWAYKLGSENPTLKIGDIR